MTLVAIEREAPETNFERAVRWSGRIRVEKLDNGNRYYTTVDERGRAVVGPRAKRRGGWWPFFTLRRKQTTEGRAVARKAYFDGEAVNPALVRIMEAETNILNRVPRVNFKMSFPSPPPTPQEKKPSAWKRASEWWSYRFYSEEWHRAVRNTAYSILIWAVAVLVVVLIGKVILWAV